MAVVGAAVVVWNRDGDLSREGKSAARQDPGGVGGRAGGVFAAHALEAKETPRRLPRGFRSVDADPRRSRSGMGPVNLARSS